MQQQMMVKEIRGIDWDFKGYKRGGIHNIHWVQATYIPQIPSILISILGNNAKLIFDGYCASGTTLIESIRLGKPCIGVDINPLFCEISRSKITYYDLKKLNNFCEDIKIKIKKNKESLIPDFPNRENWYEKNTLKELGEIFYIVENEKNQKYQRLLRVLFSSILKRCCSQTEHYTYVADNMFISDPKKLKYVDAKKEFEIKINKFFNSMHDFYQELKHNKINIKKILSECSVYQKDSRHLDFIESGSIDFIVTSPPYVNVTDYATGHRLSFYWMKYLGDMKEIKDLEIGARWKRSRKNAVNEYLSDMTLSFNEMFRILRNNSYLCCVLSETSSENKKGNIIDELKKIFVEKVGFELVDGNISRNIHGKRIRTKCGVKKEEILILRKK